MAAAMLRRSAPVLGRSAVQLQAPAACGAGFARLPLVACAEQDATARQRLAYAADFRRGFAAQVPAANDQPATSVALKNPTPIIEYDEGSHARFAPGDPGQRAFTYFALSGGRFIYASAVRLLVLKFLMSMSAAKDVLAMATLEVELDKVAVGDTIVVKWRGKPVFIRHRTPEQIAGEQGTKMGELRDPQTDVERAANPEWLIVLGVCTHLGCVPISGAGEFNGWFCPCHGSHYDGSGRIRKGPAPLNLEVPEYSFSEDGSKLMIG